MSNALDTKNVAEARADDARLCWRCGGTFAEEVEHCPKDGTRLISFSAASERDPNIGRLLGDRFLIERKLGQGGMGTVYIARQKGVDRTVAVKLLRREYSRDPVILGRFFAEARAISSLSHPHTIKLVDFGQAEDGTLYMVTEFLNGETLSARMARGDIELPEMFRIFIGVCGALHEAHRKNIVHRDLKPENIFLMEIEGEHHAPTVPKVLDFGLAKLLDDTETGLTRTGLVCGTPAYMSPEQASGKEVDGRSDLYALGVLMYEIIAGRLPFEADSPMSVMLAHISKPPTPLRALSGCAWVPEKVDELVMSLLAKRPADRPASADVLRLRLDDLILNFALEATRGDEEQAEHERRRKQRSSAAQTVLKSVAVPPILPSDGDAAYQLSEPSRAAVRAEASARVNRLWLTGLAVALIVILASIYWARAVIAPPAERIERAARRIVYVERDSAPSTEPSTAEELGRQLGDLISIELAAGLLGGLGPPPEPSPALQTAPEE